MADRHQLKVILVLLMLPNTNSPVNYGQKSQNLQIIPITHRVARENIIFPTWVTDRDGKKKTRVIRN